MEMPLAAAAGPQFFARGGAALGPTLGPWVRSVWASRGLSAAPEERVLPDGGCALLVNLGPTLAVSSPGASAPWPTGAVLVSGPMRCWARVRYPAGAQQEQVGVLFHPGGAAGLFSEILEEDDLRVADPDAIGLRDPALVGLLWALAAAPRLEARVALLAEGLRGALARAGAGGPPLGAQLLSLCAARPESSAAGLAAASGWTAQHLNRRLRAEGGLSLKGLQRVARLQRALAGLRASGPLSAASAAIAYADQAHFNHDLVALTGLRPGALRALGPPVAGRILHLGAEVQNLQGAAGARP